MAISQNALNDPALRGVFEAVDEVLEGIDAPAQVGSFIKSDLEDAFTAKSAKAPQFAPGYTPQLKIGVVGLVSDPLRTMGKAFAAPLQKDWQELILTPAVDTIIEEVDDAVWDHLFNKTWAGVVPGSTRQTISRWNARRHIEPIRRGAAAAVENDPGMIFMMSKQLERVGVSTVNGYRVSDISKDAEWQSRVLNDTLVEAEKALKLGDVAKANDLFNYAEKNILKDYKTGSEAYRKDLIQQFDGGVRRGLITGPEASAWRYLKARNLRSQTLNFLRTYHEDGVWGVVKYYGWQELKKRIGYSRFTNFVGAKVLGPLGLNRLAQVAFRVQTVIKRFTSGLAKKATVWVIKKLGLRQFFTWLGGLIGGAVSGGLATPLGAIAGAVLSFVAEIALKKVGGVFKIVGYVMVSVIGCFTLFAVGIITLISIILSNNPYPWEQGGSAAGAQRFVQVEVKACESSATCAVASYQNPLRISNGSHDISWRVVIKNISSQDLTEAEFNFSQAQCTGSEESGFELAPGEERIATCSSEFNETDDVVSNVVSFASAEPVVVEEAVGIVIFGNPPITIPTGWPLASGCISQGPGASFSHGIAEAIDIPAVTGTAVRATFNGVVQLACWKAEEGCDPDGYGNYVRVSSLDGSFSAVFAHLASTRVDTGDSVTVGQQLGTVNSTGHSTGAHLHYEFSGLPMSEPYIPRDTGGNGSIRGCSDSNECSLCF